MKNGGKVVDSEEFEGRGDKEWLYFTLAEAYFGLGIKEKENQCIELGNNNADAGFAFNSYSEQKEKLSAIIYRIKNKLNEF